MLQRKHITRKKYKNKKKLLYTFETNLDKFRGMKISKQSCTTYINFNQFREILLNKFNFVLIYLMLMINLYQSIDYYIKNTESFIFY